MIRTASWGTSEFGMLFTYVGGHPFSFFFLREEKKSSLQVKARREVGKGLRAVPSVGSALPKVSPKLMSALITQRPGDWPPTATAVWFWKDPQWTCAQYVVSAWDGEIRNKVVEEVENGQNSHNDLVLMAISWKIEMLHRNGAYGIFVFFLGSESKSLNRVLEGTLVSIMENLTT